MSTATFTACALVQTRTETVKVLRWDAETRSHICEGERTETKEIGRIEFVPMGEWVLVRVAKVPNSYGNAHAWEASTRDDARKLYKAHAEGRGWYAGKWESAPATTKIVGSLEQPARRQEYSYGETAYMYVMVDFPAMTCPVLEMEPGRKCALQPFEYTTPPTPGDPHRNTRKAIQFTRVAA